MRQLKTKVKNKYMLKEFLRSLLYNTARKNNVEETEEKVKHKKERKDILTMSSFFFLRSLYKLNN